MAHSLLLVEDDRQVRTVLSKWLKSRGFVVHEAGSIAEAREVVSTKAPDLVVIDYYLPDGTAADFLRGPGGEGARDDVAVIVLTGEGTIDLAVDAMKLGADHFLTKPADFGTMGLVIERVLEARQHRRRHAAERAQSRSGPDPFTGTSRAVKELAELAQAVVHSSVPILVLGETGTGKGVLARWLHENGPRAAEPFVDLNCAGLSKELSESELFGHQRGAFTNAHSDKRGLLEVAHRGSVFLDEIGDLDVSVQPKLLKVLEDRRFRRVGDLRDRTVDVRIVAATHRDLAKMSAAGQFRSDLLFRINAVTFEITPLRRRPEDIAPLAEKLLQGLCQSSGLSQKRLSMGAIARLSSYAWPGNIRELRNVLERALLFSRSDDVGADNLVFGSSGIPESEPPESATLEDVERRHIERVVRAQKGAVDKAAALLAIPRSSLYAKLKKYDIQRE
jgi:DNA-binding NtrC family response regulator